MNNNSNQKHKHYYRNVEHLNVIDIYRTIDLFQIHHPCLQHAVKKIICAGDRGSKDFETDVQEAIDSLVRALQMVAEDRNKIKNKIDRSHIEN